MGDAGDRGPVPVSPRRILRRANKSICFYLLALFFLATLRGPPEQAHVRGDLGPRPYRDPNPDATSHEGRAIVLSPFELAVPFHACVKLGCEGVLPMCR